MFRKRVILSLLVPVGLVFAAGAVHVAAVRYAVAPAGNVNAMRVCASGRA